MTKHIFLKKDNFQSIIINITTYSFPANYLLYYYSNIVKNNTLLILISQSGESIEIRLLLDVFKDHTLKIGITNAPNSTLSRTLDRVLFLNAGKERATTSKTYINTLAMILKLSSIFAQEEFDFLRISKKIDKYLEDEEKIVDIFYPYFLGTNYITLLGRGISLSTAYQGALILKEAAHFYAEGMDTYDFRHGPLDMVSEGFRTIIFSSYEKKEVFEKDILLAKKIVSQNGALLFVTNRSIDEEFPTYIVDEESPYLTPFFDIIPLQFISCQIAWGKAMEPGTLSNTGKVVIK